MSKVANPTFMDAVRAATSVVLSSLPIRRNLITETLIQSSWTTSGEGKDVWTDDDYTDVYRKEPWVYSCVNAIADDISKLRLEIVDAKGDVLPEPWPEPLQILAHPSNLMTIKDLLRSYTIDELMIGEAFAHFTGDEILWMPSRRTSAVTDPVKGISHFEVKSQGKTPKRFEVEEVAYLHRGAPDLVVEGMSHLTPLADTMIQMASQVRYEKGLWANDARPSGLLITEKHLDPYTRDETISVWNSTYGGVGNAGKTAILSDGLDYKRMGMSQEESQYLENRKMHREEILAVFNVPPVRVGLLEYASFANAVEQMAMYWGSTILPLAERIAAVFEAILFPGTGFRLRFNADHIDALTIAKERLYDIAIKACGNRAVLTQNEARLLIGKPLSDDPKADELSQEPAFALGADLPDIEGSDAEGSDADDEKLIDQSVEAVSPQTALNGAQVTALLDIISQVAQGLLPRDSGVALIHAAFPLSVEQADELMGSVGRDFVPTPEDETPPAGDANPTDDTRGMEARRVCVREAAQLRKARHHIAIERETELCARDVALPLLETMEAANVKAVNADLRTYGPRVITRDDRPPDVPLPSEFDKELKDNLKSFLLGTFERVVAEEEAGLNQLKRNLRQFARDKSKFETREATIESDFNVVDPAIMQAIERRTVQISTVPKTIQAMVRKVIADGVKEGVSIQEIADRIRGLFSQLKASHAMTIARTEAGAGTNEAAHLAQSQSGVSKKAWSQANAGQEKRSSHTVNEQAGEILFGARFPGNGMLHPQESGFSAEETINCMCVSYATDFE